MELPTNQKSMNNNQNSGTRSQIPISNKAESFIISSLWIRSTSENNALRDEMEKYHSLMTINCQKILLPDDYIEIIISDKNVFLSLWLSTGSSIYKEKKNTQNDVLWINTIIDSEKKIVYKHISKKSDFNINKDKIDMQQ